MKILALIPARMRSSRFPGKPMAELIGRPMIEHVYRRVAKNSAVTLTAVATCDEEIAAHIRRIGGGGGGEGGGEEGAPGRGAGGPLGFGGGEANPHYVVCNV